MHARQLLGTELADAEARPRVGGSRMPVFDFTTNSFTQIGVVTSKTLWAGSGGDVRGIAAGTDLDGDGKQEVWTTHYNVPNYKGGKGGDGVYGFEYVGSDTLVQILYETKLLAKGVVSSKI